jgi:hypothetical protein
MIETLLLEATALLSLSMFLVTLIVWVSGR